MFFIWYGIGAFIAIAIACFWYCSVIAKTKSMNNKFIKLGDMRGKTLKEIEEFVGPAQEYERKIAQNTGNWVTVATWSKGKYQIIIMFDANGYFDHIVSQGVY